MPQTVKREHFAQRQVAVARDDDGTFNYVFKFADVARPMVGAETTQAIGRQFEAGPSDAGTVAFDEESSQKFDIGVAVAKRRNRNRKNVKPVIEIFAKAAGTHLLSQVPIGRRDNADVYLPRVGTADRFVFALLKHSQELGLKLGRKVAYFIKKENSAVCELKPADTTVRGARESALFMAKELAFAECRGNRRTVDTNEWLGRSLTLLMNRAGNKFLASASFTLDQNARWRRRDLVHGIYNRADCWTVSYNLAGILPFGDFALQIFRFRFELMEAALGSQLVFHISKNNAVTRASGKIKPGDTGLGWKLRAI